MATHRVNLDDKEIDFLLNLLPRKEDIAAQLERKFRFSRKRITVKSAKDKGRRLQQWVCVQLSELLGISYDQSDDECLIHSREMGQRGCDIVLRGEARERFLFAIECKSSERLDLPGAIAQAKENSVGDKWLLVHRRKGLQEPVVILSWESFASLWRGYDSFVSKA